MSTALIIEFTGREEEKFNTSIEQKNFKGSWKVWGRCKPLKGVWVNLVAYIKNVTEGLDFVCGFVS